jgi:hypothetical protein
MIRLILSGALVIILSVYLFLIRSRQMRRGAYDCDFDLKLPGEDFVGNQIIKKSNIWTKR